MKAESNHNNESIGTNYTFWNQQYSNDSPSKTHIRVLAQDSEEEKLNDLEASPTLGTNTDL